MTKSTHMLLYRATALCGLACLCWFALACAGDKPEVSDAPNYEATVAAALEKANVLRTHNRADGHPGADTGADAHGGSAEPHPHRVVRRPAATDCR